jgi:methyl-accepting chemotaxis protein
MSLSIKTKLISSFSLLTLLTIVLGFFILRSLKKIENIEKEFDYLDNQTSIANDLRFNVNNIWQYFTDASLTGSAESIEFAKSYFDESKNKIKQLIELNSELKPKLLHFEKQIKELYDNGQEMYVTYLNSKEKGNEIMAKVDKIGTELSKELETFSNELAARDEAELNKLHNEIIYIENLSSVITLTSILLAILVSFVIVRSIISSIIKIKKGTQRFSNGELNTKIEIKSNDEFKELAESFNQMASEIKYKMDLLELQKREVEQAVVQAEQARREVEKTQEYLSRNTKILLENMDKFADGDLTITLIPEKENDEIGRLFLGFNEVLGRLREMIAKVTEAIETTASATQQISSSTEQLASSSQEFTSQVHEITSAVEEMTKTILETSKNASLAAESSKFAHKTAERGSNKIIETKEGIKSIVNTAQNTGRIIASLASKTEQIGEITQVINDIADQTNLLALNAAIEAARAGEQGRGFAVVADEVRKLAERTTKATKEIAEMIKQIQSEAKDANESMTEAQLSVENGMRLTEEIGVVLKEILDANTKVSDVINHVAVASEEQSATAEQISRNLETMSNVTNESATGIEQVAKSAEELNRLTVNLRNLIKQFKIGYSGVEKSQYYLRHNGKIVKGN